MLVNLKSRLNQIYQDVHQMTKISQLLDYLSLKALSSLAFGLLMILTVLPALVWIFGWVWPAKSFMAGALRQISLMANWRLLMVQIGYIGCLVAAIVAAKSLLSAHRAKRPILQYLNEHALPFFLALLLLWSTVSTFLSNNRELSLYGTPYRQEGLLVYFAYAGIFCLGLLIRESRQARNLLIAQVMGSIVLSTSFLINYIPAVRWTIPHLNTTVFYQINHFGYYLVLSIVASLVLMTTEPKGSRSFWIWTLSYNLSVATLILNTSLGSYLAVIGGLGLSMIFYHRMEDRLTRKRILLAIGSLGLLSIVLDLFIGRLGNDLGILARDTLNIASDAPEAASAGTGRWALWKSGVQFALMKPWFGHGPENLGALYHLYGPFDIDRPHNELIQLAASQGIPAMLLYIAGLSFHLRDFLRRWRGLNNLTIGVFTIVGAYIISSMFGNSMYYTTPYFFLVLGLSYGLLRNQAD